MLTHATRTKVGRGHPDLAQFQAILLYNFKAGIVYCNPVNQLLNIYLILIPNLGNDDILQSTSQFGKL